MAKKMRCFFVFKRQIGSKRKPSYYMVEGLRTTVHAYSKTGAMNLLEGIGKTCALGFSVLETKKCIPGILNVGYHCSHHLIAKDLKDPTPLGHIEPNSPEWEARLGSNHRLSRKREKLFHKINRRKDIGDPD